MVERPVLLYVEPAFAIDAGIMAPGKFRSLLVSAGQQRKEFVKPREIALEVGGELPEDGTEFVSQREQALREEVS